MLITKRTYSIEKGIRQDSLFSDIWWNKAEPYFSLILNMMISSFLRYIFDYSRRLKIAELEMCVLVAAVSQSSLYTPQLSHRAQWIKTHKRKIVMAHIAEMQAVSLRETQYLESTL